MATLEKTLMNIRGFISDIQEVYPDRVVAAAVSAASLIQNRIQETGIGSDGSQLGNYSDGVYKTTRAERGLPTGYVNLTFTGEMFRDVKLIEVKKGRGLTSAKIGAQFSENDDKLFYNSIRYNDDILAVTSLEQEEIQEELDDVVQELIDKNFK